VTSKNTSKPLSYEEARQLARHEDPKIREALAGREDVKPEILYYLAEDASPVVRRAIANNHAAPAHANAVLAKDADEDVRSRLADKIAKVVPGLSSDERAAVQRLTHETLQILAQDQMVRVRQVLSDALKDIADAPSDVINQLARDAELVVSGPVLEFSPVLTDEDLLEIISSGTAAGGLGAIARRSAVAENVADAIAETDDAEAISDLISNQSAQIREETLDNLVERAESVELWHAPLAGRPKLRARTASHLAQFLADNLLETMRAREDLDEKTLDAVKSVVERRIAEGTAGNGAETGGKAAHGSSLDFLKVDPPVAMARRLYDSEKLDGRIVTRAMHASDFGFVIAALIVLTNLPVEVIREIFSSQNAKGVVALAWKAGLPMEVAVQMQQRMARIAPSNIVGLDKSKPYPLDESEMTWQLEFASGIAAKQKG